MVSLAVLTDANPDWRPHRYEARAFGCGVTFEFLTTKLLDRRPQWAKLEGDPNPFAVVVMAHLKAQETVGDADARYRAKWSLTRGLYRRGYNRADVLELYRFIDWVLALPEELEQQLWNEIRIFEKEERMPYLSYAERIGYRKGAQEGEQRGEQREGRRVLEKLLRRRFARLPDWVEERLTSADAATLEDWAERVLDAESLEQVFADS